MSELAEMANHAVREGADMEFNHPPIVENDGSDVVVVPATFESADELSSSDRIAGLLSHVPGCRSALLEILSYCKTPQAEADVIALAGRMNEKKHSVYSGLSFCRMLQKAGALEHVRVDGQPFDEDSLQPKAVTEDGVEYIQAVLPPESYWKTTDEGITTLTEDNPVQHVLDIVAEEQSYAPLYKFVLEKCDEGATGEELADAIDSNPLVQEPRRYAMYFIKRLEDCGAIVWDGSWSTTADGESSLSRLADVESL